MLDAMTRLTAAIESIDPVEEEKNLLEDWRQVYSAQPLEALQAQLPITLSEVEPTDPEAIALKQEIAARTLLRSAATPQPQNLLRPAGHTPPNPETLLRAA